jgi:hypothetical protein
MQSADRFSQAVNQPPQVWDLNALGAGIVSTVNGGGWLNFSHN